MLDLHAKLSTVVRYYDRMLEERLSKAYSQQSLGGYNLPPPRQASGPYPSIAPGMRDFPVNAGPAEAFYTGQQQQPQAQASYQGVPSQAYPQYPPQASFAPYGTGSDQQSQQRQQPYGGPSAPQDQYQYPPSPAAYESGPRLQSPQQPAAATPSSDPQASYYFSPSSPAAQTRATALGPGPAADATPSPYPNLQQPVQHGRSSVSGAPPAAPVQAPTQLAQPAQQQPPSQPQQLAGPPQGQGQYWPSAVPQQSAAPQQRPGPGAAPAFTYAGYGQESFPSVPQHEPLQQPAQEEALIEF